MAAMESQPGCSTLQSGLENLNLELTSSAICLVAQAFRSKHSQTATSGTKFPTDAYFDEILSTSASLAQSPDTMEEDKKGFVLLQDEDIKSKIAELKALAAGGHSNICGDPHPSAIQICEGEVKFTSAAGDRMGLASYDVGVVVGHLLMWYENHIRTPEDNERHRQYAYTLQQRLNNFVGAYIEDMSDESVPQFMSEVAGFAACDMIVRMQKAALGQEPWTFPSSRTFTVHDYLDMGARVLRARHNIQSVYKLFFIATMAG